MLYLVNFIIFLISFPISYNFIFLFRYKFCMLSVSFHEIMHIRSCAIKEIKFYIF